MRRLILILLLIGAAAARAAAEDATLRRRPDIDVIVPVDPYPHEYLYWADGKAHHEAPGTVTIGRPGYVCDLDRRTFVSGDDLVAHLRRVHKVPPKDIPGALVTVGGQVHYPAN